MRWAQMAPPRLPPMQPKVPSRHNGSRPPGGLYGKAKQPQGGARAAPEGEGSRCGRGECRGLLQHERRPTGGAQLRNCWSLA